MSVFRNYSNAGGVSQNAHPKVHSYPWEPTQRNVRSNPNIPAQPQRIQPQERGTFFGTSASGSGTLAPQMSSGCAGCSGCGNGSASVDSPPTASEMSTGHALPSAPVKGTIARPVVRPQPRSVGAMRPAPRHVPVFRGPKLMSAALMGGRGTR